MSSVAHSLQCYLQDACSHGSPREGRILSTGCIFSRTAPAWIILHKNRLLQHGSPMDYSSCRDYALAWATLHRLQLPLGHVHVLQHVVPHGLHCGYCLHWSAMGCRETTYFTMVFSRGCREISVPVPGTHPLLLLHWPGCLQGCLSHIFFVPLSQLPHSIFTLSKICYHRGATNIGSWPHFGQQRVHPGTSWNCPCLTWGQILISSYGSCPCSSPLLPNPCHVNWIYWPKHSVSAWLGPYLGTAGKASRGCCRLMHYSKHLGCCRGFWNKCTLKLPSFLLFLS